MKFTKLIIIFLVLNFGGLFIGNILMDNGPQTDWYLNLNQAPWTPPGWAFGAAWTTIMICFSVYMANLVQKEGFKNIAVVFGIQFVLNVIWGYLFFNLHLVGIALIAIALLTLVVFYFLYQYFSVLKLKSLLILPYFLWLLVATSLNLYIILKN